MRRPSLLLAALALLLSLPVLAAPAEPPVVVVRGDYLGTGGASMKPQAEEAARVTCEALGAARVPYVLSSDSKVERDGLPTARVAILPYNRAVSTGELARLLAFVKRGGKIIACFLAPQELLTALGVRGNQVVKLPRPAEGMAFTSGALRGLPASVRNPSASVRNAAPLTGSKALGTWKVSGQPGAYPAAILSPRGVFITHTLLSAGDRAAQGALLRTLCAHFQAGLWRLSIPVRPEDVGPLGAYESLAHMTAALERRRAAGEDVSRALGECKRINESLAAARSALDRGDIDEAVRLSDAARRAAQTAYWMSYPSKPGELRGVWASNTVPGGWDAAMAQIRGANLNAVFPYMASAGVAWYPSVYLPRASQTDFLRLACDAGRKWGVPVHVRTLGLYTMCAPADFLAALRKADRLMMSPSGKTTGWLCPTSEDNQRLIIRMALEMVTGYPVSGFQVDYMRYPGDSYCFCPRCRKLFQQYIGRTLSDMPAAVKSGAMRDRFLDWRRKQITDLVRRLTNEIIAVRPDITCSGAVFLNWEDHRNEFAQDWKKWVDWGLVDMVCPMSYTPSNEKFAKYVGWQVKWVQGQVPLCPGIGVNADNMTFPGPQGLMDQITIARNMRTDGWVIFNYYDGLPTDYLPYLRLGASSTPTAFSPFQRALMPMGPG